MLRAQIKRDPLGCSIHTSHACWRVEKDIDTFRPVVVVVEGRYCRLQRRMADPTARCGGKVRSENKARIKRRRNEKGKNVE